MQKQNILKANEILEYRSLNTHFELWKKHFRYTLWRTKCELQATRRHSTKQLVYYFRVWKERNPDWKEHYYHEKVEPRAFYIQRLKMKSLEMWKSFINQNRAFNDKLIDIRVARTKLLLSETIRAWIKVGKFER